jgi:hypothetical protein
VDFGNLQWWIQLWVQCSLLQFWGKLLAFVYLSINVTWFKFLALCFFAYVVLVFLFLNANHLMMSLSSIWVWWSFKTFSLRKFKLGGWLCLVGWSYVGLWHILSFPNFSIIIAHCFLLFYYLTFTKSRAKQTLTSKSWINDGGEEMPVISSSQLI